MPTRGTFHPLQLTWALFGVLIGTVEQFFFSGRLARAPVWIQLVLRIVIIGSLAMLLVTLMLAVGWVPPALHKVGIDQVSSLWAKPIGTGLMVSSVIVAALVMLFMEMERMVGSRMFRRFLTGRYVHPKRERLVVMFMDLAGSTSWTEKLGDDRYYAMLNETFDRMSAPVLRSDAEILKYIGDEVIFTWSVARGARDARCLDLYFDIHEAIERDPAHYQRTYGMVPRFRAGIHCGEVITSQVGSIKRTIDHSGDAMNTCARLVGATKELDTDLVASEDLLAAVPATDRFTLGTSTAVSCAVRPGPCRCARDARSGTSRSPRRWRACTVRRAPDDDQIERRIWRRRHHPGDPGECEGLHFDAPAVSTVTAGGLTSHTFDMSQLTTSPTRQPKITSSTLWIPCITPTDVEPVARPAAMTTAAVMGAWRHITLTRTR